MRKLILTVAATLALAGCGGNAQTNDGTSQASEDHAQISGNAAQIKIADIDFFNLRETSEIAKQLVPADAVLFLEYVIAWKAAKVSGDESEILKSDGTLPGTVAEAVEITRAVQAKMAATGGQ